MNDNFLSFLVENKLINPDSINKLTKLYEHPRYFLLQGMHMGLIENKDFNDLNHLASEGESLKKIVARLVINKILTAELTKNIMTEMRTSFEILKMMMSESGMLDISEIEQQHKKFELTLKSESDNGIKIGPLDMVVVSSDAIFRGGMKEQLVSEGHKVTTFKDMLEASDRLDDIACELLILDAPSEHQFESIEMLQVLMEVNKKLYSALTTDEELTIPSRLLLCSRFVCESKAGAPKNLSGLLKKIWTKKASLSSIESGDSAKEFTPVEALAKEVKSWLSALNINYAAQGVTLFVDPKTIRRANDRFNPDHDENRKLKLFSAEVERHLKNMKIEQIDINAVNVALWYPWSEPVKIAPKQVQAIDAKAEVKMTTDGTRVLLDYQPPSGKGTRVRNQELIRMVKNITQEFFVIDEAIRNATSSNEPISKLPVAEKRDAKIEIDYSSDHSEAYLLLHRPYGGKSITEADIADALKSNNICHGLKTDAISELCYSNSYGRKITIARGMSAQNGENGRIRYLLDEDNEQNGKNNENKNHRNVVRIDKVSKGQRVIMVEPPTAGTPGINVHKEKILPVKGKPVKFSVSSTRDADADIIIGENLQLVMDGTVVISDIEGMIKRKDKRISVVPVFEVNGDVDYSIGNIDMNGDVVVQGNVLSKFHIRASGDVHVLGSIEDAIVECSGTVYVGGGIYGHEKGIVFGGISVEARCIEQANVFTRGNIKTKTNISHSLVVAYDSIEVSNPDGYVVGGVLKAGNGVTTSKLGSLAGTLTSIDVACALSIPDEMEQLRTSMLKKISITERTPLKPKSKDDEKKTPGEKNSDGEDQPDEKYGGLKLKTYNKYFLDWLEEFVKKNKNKMSTFVPSEKNTRYKIVAETRTYPGVWMKIKGFGFSIKNELAGKRVFSLSGDDIRESV